MSGVCEYKYTSENEQISEHNSKKLEIIRLISVASVMIFIAWFNLLPSILLSNLIILITVVVGEFPVFKESFVALRKGHINMELSMVIAIIASLFLFQFLPAIAITFFALLSEFIEELIIEKGRQNIKTLYKNAPKKAIVKRDKRCDSNNNSLSSSSILTEEIPVSEVKTDDIVIVREGDIVPVDGKIIQGSSTIDQSTITGESIPVEKDMDDFVYAGTINLTSKLEVVCTKTSIDSTYSKIIHLVEESESSKAPIQKLSDKMATRLVQFAIGLSILTFIVTQNLVSTLSVIVVAGACGLAVGTPIALLASNSKLAKKGIIVKGGIQIENVRNSGTVIFDKTGTLTIGKPAVTQVISFYETIEPRKILEYASLAERDVNHPLAKAIIQKSKEEKIVIKETTTAINDDVLSGDDFHQSKNSVKIGRGAYMFHQGHRITVGSIKFLEE